MVAAVEKSGVAYQAGYMWRYDDIANRLRRMVQQDAFGKLISVEMTFATSDVARRGPDHYLFDPAASGAGFFSWLACHWLDTLLFVTGRAVVGVTARTGVYGAVPAQVEDGGAAILELEGGGIATFVGGYWHPRWAGESRWAIRGSQRWVHWDANRKGTNGVLEIHGPQPQWHAMEDVYHDGRGQVARLRRPPRAFCWCRTGSTASAPAAATTAPPPAARWPRWS